jgi:hypothetical protein
MRIVVTIKLCKSDALKELHLKLETNFDIISLQSSHISID